MENFQKERKIKKISTPQNVKCLFACPYVGRYPIRRTCFQTEVNKSFLPTGPAAPYAQRWSCCSPLSFSFFEKICLNPLMLVITYFGKKFSKIYYNKFISVFLPNQTGHI
jgi:hypothetical protein